MKHPASEKQTRITRLKRLAESIDALAEKDARSIHYAREIASLRDSAAAEIYGICSEFVSDLNSLLTHGEITLDPSLYSHDSFRETGNLVQINVRGRILQVDYRAAPDLVSTEDFRIPYTLEGTVRAFNQELLDKDLIEEQLIFYTVENHRRMWRFFDARTYRSGPFDQDYLAGLLEQLI